MIWPHPSSGEPGAYVHVELSVLCPVWPGVERAARFLETAALVRPVWCGVGRPGFCGILVHSTCFLSGRMWRWQLPGPDDPSSAAMVLPSRCGVGRAGGCRSLRPSPVPGLEWTLAPTPGGVGSPAGHRAPLRLLRPLLLPAPGSTLASSLNHSFASAECV
ncbi:hypothetical protein NDU88_001807 [Pleurodeles waltl]|uniref:Uncharacterized protein n=1 Tax=Pleurodeles waltl TaxID=8319 RepID=A0AAV7U8P2_PLEWA|nr:hypothetical protein NDU88_001807 [Pleurodeles waltl]